MPKKPAPKIKFSVYFMMLCFFAIAAVVGVTYWKYKLEKKSQQTFYKGFETTIPNNYNIHGIDVSKYQSYIYWNAVKKMEIDNITIDFAFIKATEGVATIDAMFKKNWQQSKKNNITHGAYHYFLATKDGKLQAQHFIKNINLQNGDLPPVIDIEKDFGVNNSTLKNRLKDCLNELQNNYGVKPILYTYADFYNNVLGEDFDNYPLWVAHYTDEDIPDVNRNWLFWQHSESGRVNGITEKVDFNVFAGDSNLFNKILIK